MWRALPAMITPSRRWPCRRVCWIERRKTRRHSSSSGTPIVNGQEEEAARELVLGQEAADPHQACGEPGRLEDQLVLLGTGSEEVTGVGTDGEQHGGPADEERARGDADDVDDVGRRPEEGELLPPDHGDEDRQGKREQVTDRSGERNQPRRLGSFGACHPVDGVVEQRHVNCPPEQGDSRRTTAARNAPAMSVPRGADGRKAWGEVVDKCLTRCPGVRRPLADVHASMRPRSRTDDLVPPG